VDKVIPNWQSVYHWNKQLVQLVNALQQAVVNVNKSQSYLAVSGIAATPKSFFPMANRGPCLTHDGLTAGREMSSSLRATG